MGKVCLKIPKINLKINRKKILWRNIWINPHKNKRNNMKRKKLTSFFLMHDIPLSFLTYSYHFHLQCHLDYFHHRKLFVNSDHFANYAVQTIAFDDDAGAAVVEAAVVVVECGQHIHMRHLVCLSFAMQRWDLTLECNGSCWCYRCCLPADCIHYL